MKWFGFFSGLLYVLQIGLWMISLTRYAVRLHFEVGDVVGSGPVIFSPHPSAPGPHGRESAACVDLIRDGLQVPKGRPVLGFGLGQFSLTLVDPSLQLLYG